MKAAVIGIGSNSVRMLVAEIEGHKGYRLRRDREGTRLFAGLDEQGNLSAASMEATVDAVAKMAREARAEGAVEVRLFATSATRDAANAHVFAALLREKAQVELEICSGENEASLSFLGATDGGFTGVIDIGGGSTEVIVGDGLDVEGEFSCQMGAVRLFRLQPIANKADMETVQRMAEAILEENLKAHPLARLPQKWIGTGGTFTTLASMSRGVSWRDRSMIHGSVITQTNVRRLGEMLADMPLAQRHQLPGLQPNRADIVVHGICILLACMKRFDIREIGVSEYGNLDGYVKRCYQLTEGLY